MALFVCTGLNPKTYCERRERMETKGMVHPEGLEFNEHLASGQESEAKPARKNIYERIWDKLEKILGILQACPNTVNSRPRDSWILGSITLGATGLLFHIITRIHLVI